MCPLTMVGWTRSIDFVGVSVKLAGVALWCPYYFSHWRLNWVVSGFKQGCEYFLWPATGSMT